MTEGVNVNGRIDLEGALYVLPSSVLLLICDPNILLQVERPRFNSNNLFRNLICKIKLWHSLPQNLIKIVNGATQKPNRWIGGEGGKTNWSKLSYPKIYGPKCCLCYCTTHSRRIRQGKDWIYHPSHEEERESSGLNQEISWKKWIDLTIRYISVSWHIQDGGKAK